MTGQSRKLNRRTLLLLLGSLAFSPIGSRSSAARSETRDLRELPPDFWSEFRDVSVDTETSRTSRNHEKWIAVGYQRGIARAALAQRMLGNEPASTALIRHLEGTLTYRDDQGRFVFDMIRGTRHYELARVQTAAFFLVDLYHLALAFQTLFPRHTATARLLHVVESTRADYVALRDSALQVSALNARAPNRVILMSRCLALGARVLQDPSGRSSSADVLSIAQGLQAKEGYFPESGGYDVGYHAVSLLQLGLRRYWAWDDVLEQMLHRGSVWFRGRIASDGRIDFSGSTRTTDAQEPSSPLIRFNGAELSATCLLLWTQTGDDRYLEAYRKLKMDLVKRSPP